jgi:hypothetical protein
MVFSYDWVPEEFPDASAVEIISAAMLRICALSHTCQSAPKPEPPVRSRSSTHRIEALRSRLFVP